MSTDRTDQHRPGHKRSLEPRAGAGVAQELGRVRRGRRAALPVRRRRRHGCAPRGYVSLPTSRDAHSGRRLTSGGLMQEPPGGPCRATARKDSPDSTAFCRARLNKRVRRHKQEAPRSATTANTTTTTTTNNRNTYRNNINNNIYYYNNNNNSPPNPGPELQMF